MTLRQFETLDTAWAEETLAFWQDQLVLLSTPTSDGIAALAADAHLAVARLQHALGHPLKTVARHCREALLCHEIVFRAAGDPSLREPERALTAIALAEISREDVAPMLTLLPIETPAWQEPGIASEAKRARRIVLLLRGLASGTEAAPPPPADASPLETAAHALAREGHSLFLTALAMSLERNAAKSFDPDHRYRLEHVLAIPELGLAALAARVSLINLDELPGGVDAFPVQLLRY